MLQVLLALRVVLGVDVTHHRHVEADDRRDLVGNRDVVGSGLRQEVRQAHEILAERAAAGRRAQQLDRAGEIGRRRDVVEDVARGLRAEAVEEQEDAVPRHGVARIRDDTQVREHVLDVRRLDELEAAALHERDVVLLELELEIEGVEARAEEHATSWREAILTEPIAAR